MPSSVDRQTRPYLFRGREIDSVTGRVRCWMFTDLVTIDEDLRFGGVSHPLTLCAAPPRRRRRREVYLDAPERLRP